MRLFLQQRVTSNESVSHFARRKTPITKGYEVHGIIRRANTFNTSRIDHLYANPHINGVRMFLQYTDTGGLIPAFVANRLSQIGIGRLFEAVRKQVKDPKYTAEEH